jgi:hypothetical protein
MGHDLIVTTIQNEHAKKIIARLICQKQSIPLQKALQIVTSPPFIFLVDVSITEIQTTVSQLKPLGVTFKTIDTKKNPSDAPPILNQNQSVKNTVSYTPVENVKEISRPIIHHFSSEVINTEKKSKRSIFITIIGITIICLPLLLIGISLNKRPSAFLSNYTGRMQLIPVEKKDLPRKNQSNSKNMEHVELPIDKARSDSYTDSASVLIDDYNQALAFYLLAISFNKYNYKAWYGLINTYYNMNRIENAHKAEAEMKKLFGNAIFDVNKIIERFGTMISVQLDKDSVYSIEYKSTVSNKKALMSECYQIIRALKPTCNCLSISLFASHTAGTGLIVHIKRTDDFFSQFEFEKVASITYLE